ncbi:hypothetical protein EX30DRAFT_351830 [Ascodesmis nigricans]|uniref:Uncharacterized protein n=1 Tax=Ascodesmis nigricans TaxID=341454 RepID=A0A4S2MKA7_9PEZI|nr:hypothetical protein EX30DRAFT_351830 [Ascodesmis nigricans]
MGHNNLIRGTLPPLSLPPTPNLHPPPIRKRVLPPTAANRRQHIEPEITFLGVFAEGGSEGVGLELLTGPAERVDEAGGGVSRHHIVLDPRPIEESDINIVAVFRHDVGAVHRTPIRHHPPNFPHHRRRTYTAFLGETTTPSPALFRYITKTQLPAIWSPIPMPAHPLLVGAVIWKNVSLPVLGRLMLAQRVFWGVQKVETGIDTGWDWDAAREAVEDGG